MIGRAALAVVDDAQTLKDAALATAFYTVCASR